MWQKELIDNLNLVIRQPDGSKCIGHVIYKLKEMANKRTIETDKLRNFRSFEEVRKVDPVFRLGFGRADNLMSNLAICLATQTHSA